MLVIATTACISLANGGGGSPGRGRGPRDDRVVVTRFSDVRSLAATNRLLFAATPYGLAIYDRVFDSWLPPLAGGADYAPQRVTALGVVPAIDAVWIGGDGVVTYYQPASETLTRTPIAGTVDLIIFDRRDILSGPFVRTTDGRWSRVTASGFVSPLQQGEALPPAAEAIVTPSLADVYREFPGVQSFERLITRDAQLRSWPVVAGTRSPDRSEVWLGTAGNGIYRVDPFANQGTHLPYGLLARGVGAVARAADGVWAAGLNEEVGDRGGLSYVGDELQEFRWLEGSNTMPLIAARAFDLEVRGTQAWIATDRGLVRLNTRDENDVTQWTQLHGLPSDLVYSVASNARGAWAGTASGLAFVLDSSGRRTSRPTVAVRTIATSSAVRALLLAGDSLWVGSDAGLLLLPPGDSSKLVRAPNAGADPRLALPVVGLARSDSLLVVATPDELVRYDLASRSVLPRFSTVDVRAVGGVTAVAADARTIWVAGLRGVMVISRAAEVSRFLAVGTDLPASALDVALTPDYAWIATRDGLVRLARLTDGTSR